MSSVTAWANPPAAFSHALGGEESINGVPVTEAQIAAWATEAEVGYDVDALHRRGRGRPGRGAESAQVVALRLTTEELAVLDARAARENKSRSELIREAIASYAA
jgi:Ribbon-helix-helix protein, copG family